MEDHIEKIEVNRILQEVIGEVKYFHWKAYICVFNILKK